MFRFLAVPFIFGLACVHLPRICDGIEPTPAPWNEMHKWTDETGNYSTNAKLVGIKDKNVLLLKENGKTSTVPISRLSSESKELAKKMLKEMPKAYLVRFLDGAKDVPRSNLQAALEKYEGYVRGPNKLGQEELVAQSRVLKMVEKFEILSGLSANAIEVRYFCPKDATGAESNLSGPDLALVNEYIFAALIHGQQIDSADIKTIKINLVSGTQAPPPPPYVEVPVYIDRIVYVPVETSASTLQGSGTECCPIPTTCCVSAPVESECPKPHCWLLGRLFGR